MSKDISREFLKVSRLHKDLVWLSYDPDYKDIDLKTAISIVKLLKDKLEKQIEGNK